MTDRAFDSRIDASEGMTSRAVRMAMGIRLAFAAVVVPALLCVWGMGCTREVTWEHSGSRIVRTMDIGGRITWLGDMPVNELKVIVVPVDGGMCGAPQRVVTVPTAASVDGAGRKELRYEATELPKEMTITFDVEERGAATGRRTAKSKSSETCTVDHYLVEVEAPRGWVAVPAAHKASDTTFSADFMLRPDA